MPKKAKPLTDRDVERLKTDGRQLRVGVGGAPGLMVVVNEGGSRQFFATYRILGDVRKHWLPLGQWIKPVPDPTDASRWLGYGVEAARRDAAEVHRMAKNGLDPKAARMVNADRLKWEGLIDLYLAHAKGKKSSDWAESMIERHLRGAFPGRFAADIRRTEIKELHGRIKAGLTGQVADRLRMAELRKEAAQKAADGEAKEAGRLERMADRLEESSKALQSAPVAADRCLALLRKAFALAIDAEKVTENPVAGLDIDKSVKVRKRFLDAPDLVKLGEALEKEESWQAVAMVRLLLTTGLRLSEVLTLRWDEVDLERRTVTKKEHKTSKDNGDLVQPLSADAASLLADLANKKLSAWVLPGEDSKKHFAGEQKAWQRIRKAAKLEDVHLHDLRRTFATWGSLTGQEVNVVSKLLNHSDVSITSRVYAQADLESRAKVAGAIASGIAAALGGKG